jgi:hypothetical protein
MSEIADMLAQVEKDLAPAEAAALKDAHQLVSDAMDKVRADLPQLEETAIQHVRAVGETVLGHLEDAKAKLEAKLGLAPATPPAPPAAVPAPAAPVADSTADAGTDAAPVAADPTPAPSTEASSAPSSTTSDASSTTAETPAA